MAARADRDQQGSSQTGRASDSGGSSGGSGNGRADRDQQTAVGGRLQGTGPAPTRANNSREADDEMAAKYGVTPDQYTHAASELGNKILDAKDFGEGLLNTFGKGVLSMFGYSEVDPTTSPETLSQSWGDSLADAQAGITRPLDESARKQLDPVKAALTVASPFTGGIGTVANAVYSAYGLTGLPRPEIDLGMTGPATPDNLTASQRQLAGLDDPASTTQGLVRGPTVGPGGGAGTKATQGLVRPAAAAPALQQSAPVPTNPATPAAPVRTDFGFPTPTQKFGASQISYYYDPSTGTLVPKAA